MTGDKPNGESGDNMSTDSSPVSSEWDGSLSLLVVNTVAEREETNPTEMTPLNEAIDPDALDALFEGREFGICSFKYLGYEIVVNEEGSISISNMGEQEE